MQSIFILQLKIQKTNSVYKRYFLNCDVGAHDIVVLWFLILILLHTRSRIPAYRVHYHRSLYHDNNYVLSILFSFDKDDDSYQFSYSYPYSYTRYQNYLSMIEKKKLPYFKRELLGQSIVINLNIIMLKFYKNTKNNGEMR